MVFTFPEKFAPKVERTTMEGAVFSLSVQAPVYIFQNNVFIFAKAIMLS